MALAVQGAPGCHGPGRAPRRLSPSSPKSRNHRQEDAAGQSSSTPYCRKPGRRSTACRRGGRCSSCLAWWQNPGWLPDTPETAPVTASQVSRYGSGKSIKRVEDDALLRGRGLFADNVPAAGQLHAYFLRSPHPHARITRIDVEAAAAMPGVQRILTGAELLRAGVKPIPNSADFRRAGGKPTATPPHHALAIDTVRYVGEAVAAVIAATVAEARDAAEAIQVDYDPLPAVVDATAAVAPGAATVVAEAPDNIACEIRHGDPAAAEAAFMRAAHVVALDLVNQRVAPSPIEPRSTLATWDATDDRLTLRVSCQTPTGLRDELCDPVLGIPKEKVRVIVGDVGGGFGMKTSLYPEDVVVAFAARELKRPVRHTAERIEEFLGAGHGRDVTSKAELALDRDGRILALRVASLANVGAYATPAGVVIQLLIGPWVSTSVYDIPTIDIGIKAVLTHTLPTGPYRGAGRPEAIYIIERLMDAAARRTGIDRIELRRRNMIRPEQMPYTNPMGKTYDSGQFAKVMDEGLALADWKGFEARAADSKLRGRLRGQGIATFLEWTGADVFEEAVTVTVTGAGEIEIFTAAQAMGQGLATTFAQLAVDVFGVAVESIQVRFGDTDRATGFGSAGSRSLFVVGSAVQVAAERTVARAQDLAAKELETAVGDIEYREGVFSIAGTDRRIGLFELARRQAGERIALQSTSSVGAASWPNGCHVCEVEIDPDTGSVELDGYWSVNDVGRVVNPMVVVGQLEGGAMQGIGQALCERFVYDTESGQALTASFMDYALPRASDTCRFEMTMDESTPCLTNPMGVKGVGELGTIGATPAVVNAVIDALARHGFAEQARGLQMPLTPERVWQALHG
ncbi:MAG: xanthine dehydrogenase family protein [Betaproteobacteria bacterium]|nr:xanthine dehydrogenase family protein [Betaproteobacteria bacterium]